MIFHFAPYARLFRLDRPIGSYLLLWPALWAMWISSSGQPPRLIFLVFVLGVLLLRAAGCALNDFFDRDIDGHVARTRNRPLVTGELRPTDALIAAALLLLLAFCLVLLLNLEALFMACGALLLAVTYPLAKRWHSLPQLHLGVAFGWSVPMVWLAIHASAPPPSIWVLYLACIVWTVAYDTMYALADRDEDLLLGMKSSAILFAGRERLLIAILQVLMLLLLVAVGFLDQRGTWFFWGILIAAFLCFYQQWLIKDLVSEQCIAAFTSNHWLGIVVFSGLFVDILPD